jgi:hypothetical protein
LQLRALYLLLPLTTLILLFAPIAKAVQNGALGLTPALGGGVACLALLTVAGYAMTTARVAQAGKRCKPALRHH